MNPLLQDFISSLLRKWLSGIAGAMVTHGYFTSQKAEEYVSGIILFIVTVGWGWAVDKYKRTKVSTALATPYPQTEKQLENQIANGAAAPASTPKTEVPEVKNPSAAP